MSALRLAVLVVIGALCCIAEENQELSSLTRTVEELKEEFKKTTESVNEIRGVVEAACGTDIAPDVQPAQPPLPGSGIQENIAEKLQSIEKEVSEVKKNLHSLSQQQGSIRDVASSTELRNLHDRQVNLMTNALRALEGQLEDLPSTADVEAVVKGQTENVKEAVKEGQETCGCDDKLDVLVDTVREVQGRVEEAKEAAQETRNKLERVEQDVTEELRGVREKVDEVTDGVRELKDGLETQIQNIGGRVGELTNTTQLFVTTLEKELEKRGAESVAADTAPRVYPCLDSFFVGTAVGKVCEVAVSKQRCLRPLISYHCCRSCTDAGQLPESGDWLNVNLPRRVTPVEVFRAFTN